MTCLSDPSLSISIAPALFPSAVLLFSRHSTIYARQQRMVVNHHTSTNRECSNILHFHLWRFQESYLLCYLPPPFLEAKSISNGFASSLRVRKELTIWQSLTMMMSPHNSANKPGLRIDKLNLFDRLRSAIPQNFGSVNVELTQSLVAFSK